MRVRDIMSIGPRGVAIRAADDLGFALQAMAWGDVHYLPVTEDDRVVGVVSERDILRRFADMGKRRGALAHVEDVMGRPPVTIEADDDIAVAQRLITAGAIGALPVVRHGRLVGVLTPRDVLLAQAHDEPGRDDEMSGSEGPARGSWETLPVDAVMSRDPVTVAPNDTLRRAVDLMGRFAIRHLLVVAADDRVIGILSDRDVRTTVGNPLRAVDSRDVACRIEITTVAHAMTRAPLTLPSMTALGRVARMFADHRVGAVPIVDADGRPLGIVSYGDVLRAILKAASSEEVTAVT